MRLCFDIDGVLCQLKREGENYSDLLPVKGAVEALKKLKAEGHYIILHTARHMKTCNGDIELVIRKIKQLTLDWLSNHGIPYDEIHFGKPWADIYIDDNAFRFENWQEFHLDLLPQNRESELLGKSSPSAKTTQS